MEFHETWYSANIMCLAVTSNHSLDSMEGWVTSKFGEVVNKDVELPNLVDPNPYPPEALSRLVRYVPVQDADSLVIRWMLPYTEKSIASQPLGYFSSLVGHEGENSLLAYLKSKDLGLSLSAYTGHELWGLTYFEVEIMLTENGL